MAVPTRYRIKRVDKGLGMGKTKAGIVCEVYREEFSVDLDSGTLFAKIEVPRHKAAVDFRATRDREALNAMNVMALKLTQKTGKVFVVKEDAGKSYLEEAPAPEVPAMPPLQGVELILVRALVNLIHNQHPKWPREKVGETAAYARMGEGPYAGEWARMNARGPSRKDADDAASV